MARPRGQNKFEPYLLQSLKTGEEFEAEYDVSLIAKVRSALHYAARRAECKVTVRTSPSTTTQGKVCVRFLALPPRARRPSPLDALDDVTPVPRPVGR